MCSRLSRGGQNYSPRSFAEYMTEQGIKRGVWGFQNGEIYNARVEKINGIWRDYPRAVLFADDFFEKNIRFAVAGNELPLAVIFNERFEFATLTRDSAFDVFPVHHRMPVVLTDYKAWLANGTINEIDYKLLKAA